MKNLINIEIINSFNKKKDDSQKNVENIHDNASTLNNYNNISEISSMSMESITANQFQNDFRLTSGKKEKSGFWREVLICAIGGAVGAVAGALAMYFIFGIK